MPGTWALGLLELPGLDRPLAVRMHRMLPDGADVRSCTLTLDRDTGRWSMPCRLPATHGFGIEAQLAGTNPR